VNRRTSGVRLGAAAPGQGSQTRSGSRSSSGAREGPAASIGRTGVPCAFGITQTGFPGALPDGTGGRTGINRAVVEGTAQGRATGLTQAWNRHAPGIGARLHVATSIEQDGCDDDREDAPSSHEPPRHGPERRELTPGPCRMPNRDPGLSPGKNNRRSRNRETGRGKPPVSPSPAARVAPVSTAGRRALGNGDGHPPAEERRTLVDVSGLILYFTCQADSRRPRPSRRVAPCPRNRSTTRIRWSGAGGWPGR